MIRIAIMPEAFAAIASTLSLGSVSVEPQTDEKGVPRFPSSPRSRAGLRRLTCRRSPWRTAVLTCGLALTIVIGGCAETSGPRPVTLPANEAIALTTRVLECELKAADRYDNGHSSISEVAESVMAACYPEILRSWTAFGLSPSDPNFDSDNFKMALDHVELARRNRLSSNANSH